MSQPEGHHWLLVGENVPTPDGVSPVPGRATRLSGRFQGRAVHDTLAPCLHTRHHVVGEASGIPAEARAVLLNVTVKETTAVSYLTMRVGS